jgi:dipeptidyl aminopeptidase/acylaminoacyl peptidase
VAFLSNRGSKGQLQVHVASAVGGKARRLTNLKGALADPRWSPDGTQLGFLFTENAPHGVGPVQPAVVETGEIGTKVYYQRLSTIDLHSGTVRQVSPAGLYVYEYDWAPDGKRCALSAAHGSGDNNWYLAQLFVLTPASGESKAILKPDMQIAVPRWSPDGKTIAFIGGLMSDQGATGGDIFTVPAAGGKPVNLTPDLESSASWLTWQSAGQIVFTAHEEGGSAIARVDLDGGITHLWKGAESIAAEGGSFAVSVSRDCQTFALIRQSFHEAPEVWAGPLGQWRAVTQANQGIAPACGKAKSLHWKSDAFRIQGWLLYPVGFDPARRYPLVVHVHGGPAWASSPYWPGEYSVPGALSRQGFFVLLPNPRGSYGQGERFTRANVKDLGHGDWRDILAGVDEVLRTEPVDKDHLGIGGWSYGGYMTMWGVTQTDRFRAAVAGAGIANWQSYYGQNGIDEWLIPYFGATVYDDPAIYARSSPINFIKRVKTPTLLLVGERDVECPLPQSQEFFHALKTLGVPTKLVVYPGEGHAVTKPEHRCDIVRRWVGWFDQKLRTQDAASPGRFEWQAATPQSQGMSSKQLDALKDELAKRKTSAFLVIRNDKIVYEWYAAGHGPHKKHGAASLSKPTVAGLALALLLTDGKLKLDTPVADLVAAWSDDPRKRKITLRHLGSHTSGLADAEQDRLPHDKLTDWKGDFWKRLGPPNDPFTTARDKTPVLFEPGTGLQYSNPGIAMLGYAVTAALKDAPAKDIRTLLQRRVMRPIGVGDEDWSIGYGQTFGVDGLPLVAGWGGGSYTARAMARIGRLLLQGGDWDGQQILSKEAVRQITGDAGLPGHCGIGFWTNADGRYAKLPRDTYYGAGAGDQLLIVVPSLNLIVVRNGEALAPEPKSPKDVFEAYHDQRVKILFEPVVAAITDGSKKSTAAPYPPSPVITGIAWAPKETIIRQAKGSDNWPMTWADDDHQYTAYGDGWGFEPFVPKKLGLGFARVEGDPPGFKGVNIRSPSGEQTGDGARAKKASGMLCTGGVLYLWTRNAGNAQLAWSEDHGTSWQWADWRFTTSFGCPTFLNFGKNYAGARDEFVYVYSHDNDSAYAAADRMVLARVPKQQIKERAAYEFFNALDKKGQPLWSKEIAGRGAVFTHLGRCYRSGITYNAGLKRYLWVQIIPGTEGKKSDTRFEGGFAIYDAPQPWGPWTTVYFTEKWDVGPGETASFPTKWMSSDGKTLHLVFSGDDHFAVRRATLSVAREAPNHDTKAGRVP